MTQGVNQGLLYVLLIVCNPGDNILVPELGYPIFDQIAPRFGVSVRKYALKAEQNWEIDFEDVACKIDKNTKFLFTVNPSNPMG